MGFSSSVLVTVQSFLRAFENCLVSVPGSGILSRFTQHLPSSYPHQVQVPVTGPRARNVCAFKNNVSREFTLTSNISEFPSRLCHTTEAPTSSAQLPLPPQGPDNNIYPTPFVFPSSLSDVSPGFTGVR